jgi:glycosyl transferase family 25
MIPASGTDTATARPSDDLASAPTRSGSQAVPIFVVSLARATARREAVTRHLGALGLDFTLVDAVDGRAMSEEQRRAACAPGLTIAPGEIGCYLSHIEIYRRMGQQGLPLALVLEDDAVLNPAIVPLLRSGLASDGFDYCFLDSWSVSTSTKAYLDRSDSIRLAEGVFAWRIAPPPLGAHAYLITAAAARRRLEHALPIRAAIDRYGHLPYPSRFYTLFHPKGAWVGPTGFASLTKPSGQRDPRPWHLRWCRWTPWYRLWCLLHPSMRAARRAVPDLVAAGILSTEGRWEPLPPTPEGGGPGHWPQRGDSK